MSKPNKTKTDEPKTDRLREIIGQAIGEASMCWEPIPKGVFDSSNASRVVDKVEKQIREHFRKDERERFIGLLPEIWIERNNKEFQRGWNQCIDEIKKRMDKQKG